jgi:hypothetical protein
VQLAKPVQKISLPINKTTQKSVLGIYTQKKQQVLDSIERGLIEVEQIKQGKKVPLTINELLNEC